MTRPSFINELDWKLLVKKYKTEHKLSKVINKIKNDYPVQYLIGDVDFLHNKILVNKNVLIPRFETELLATKLIDYIKKYDLTRLNLLDLCTGSGCISIGLKSKLHDLNITAVDISFKALLLAKKNAKLNNTPINFIKKDVIKEMSFNNKFSVLVSNPPYVKKDEKVSSNTKYEPSIALYPGEDDLLFYKRILDISHDILYKKNIIAFEIGDTQAQDICVYAARIYPDATILVEKDYAERNRFIFIFNNCE